MTSHYADTLNRAADRISAPGAWTQNTDARDKYHRPVSPHDRDAVSFCAQGALMCEAMQTPAVWRGVVTVANQVASELYDCGIVGLNDSRSNGGELVASVFRLAAARIEDRGEAWVDALLAEQDAKVDAARAEHAKLKAEGKATTGSPYFIMKDPTLSVDWSVNHMAWVETPPAPKAPAFFNNWISKHLADAVAAMAAKPEKAAKAKELELT